MPFTLVTCPGNSAFIPVLSASENSLHSFKPLALQGKASEYHTWKDSERWSEASPLQTCVLCLPNQTPFIPCIQVYIADCDRRLCPLTVISNTRCNLSVPKCLHRMISVFAAQTIYATLNTSSDVWCPSLQNVPGSWVLCTQLGKLNRVVPQTLCL